LIFIVEGFFVPVSDLLSQGISLMLLGMGSVFAFLLLLIASMALMSWVAGKISDETEPDLPSRTVHAGYILSDQEVVRVINEAISRYKNDKNI